MTAPNHALAGALIGLSIANPWLALPLAFLSHFVLDAIPHYDPPGQDSSERISSKRFEKELYGQAIVCFVIVLILVIAQPKQWLAAAFGAFLGASPDLFWVPRFLYVKWTGRDKDLRNPFLRFHSLIQWKTSPKLWPIEAVWFVVVGTLVLIKL